MAASVTFGLFMGEVCEEIRAHKRMVAWCILVLSMALGFAIVSRILGRMLDVTL